MREYKTLNQINISRDALINNYKYFSALNPHAKICPVLKANAYGHGLEGIADFVDTNLAAPFICVDSLYEAYELYNKNTKTPIFIMGYTDPANYAVWKKLPFTFSVWDHDSLLALNKHQPGAHVHIKLDTGMCRLGLQIEDLDPFIQTLQTCSNLVVEGIYSHLSQADSPSGHTFTSRQIKLMKEMVGKFEVAGYSFRYKHIQATAGAVVTHDPYFNLIRLGIGFYGYSPFSSHTKEGRGLKAKLRPALTLTSRIALLKNIQPGSQVGYGGSYRAKQTEKIAVLPIGYHDGVGRGLSNLVSFQLGGVPCPVVGNISMNMLTIKIPRTVRARVGDTVTLISPDPDSFCSLYKLASAQSTIPYTILTGLHPSTRRKIV